MRGGLLGYVPIFVTDIGLPENLGKEGGRGIGSVRVGGGGGGGVLFNRAYLVLNQVIFDPKKHSAISLLSSGAGMTQNKTIHIRLTGFGGGGMIAKRYEYDPKGNSAVRVGVLYSHEAATAAFFVYLTSCSLTTSTTKIHRERKHIVVFRLPSGSLKGVWWMP